jgi:hypothetical protein
MKNEDVFLQKLYKEKSKIIGLLPIQYVNGNVEVIKTDSIKKLLSHLDYIITETIKKKEAKNG